MIKIELDAGQVRQAIVDWIRRHHAVEVQPPDVMITDFLDGAYVEIAGPVRIVRTDDQEK